jgi:hypothetical protein
MSAVPLIAALLIVLLLMCIALANLARRVHRLERRQASHRAYTGHAEFYRDEEHPP